MLEPNKIAIKLCDNDIDFFKKFYKKRREVEYCFMKGCKYLFNQMELSFQENDNDQNYINYKTMNITINKSLKGKKKIESKELLEFFKEFDLISKEKTEIHNDNSINFRNIKKYLEENEKCYLMFRINAKFLWDVSTFYISEKFTNIKPKSDEFLTKFKKPKHFKEFYESFEIIIAFFQLLINKSNYHDDYDSNNDIQKLEPLDHDQEIEKTNNLSNKNQKSNSKYEEIINKRQEIYQLLNNIKANDYDFFLKNDNISKEIFSFYSKDLEILSQNLNFFYLDLKKLKKEKNCFLKENENLTNILKELSVNYEKSKSKKKEHENNEKKLEKDLENCLKENNELREEKIELQKKKKKFKKENLNLQSSSIKLLLDNKKLTEELQEMKNAFSEIEKQNDKLKNEEYKLLNELTLAEKQAELILKKEREKLDGFINFMKEQYLDIVAKNKRDSKNIRDNNYTAICEKNLEIESLKSTNNEMKNHLKEIDHLTRLNQYNLEMIEKLKKENDKYFNDKKENILVLKKKDQELDKITGEYDVIEKQNKILMMKLEKIKSDHEVLQEKYKKLKNK